MDPHRSGHRRGCLNHAGMKIRMDPHQKHGGMTRLDSVVFPAGIACPAV